MCQGRKPRSGGSGFRRSPIHCREPPGSRGPQHRHGARKAMDKHRSPHCDAQGGACVSAATVHCPVSLTRCFRLFPQRQNAQRRYGTRKHPGMSCPWSPRSSEGWGASSVSFSCLWSLGWLHISSSALARTTMGMPRPSQVRQTCLRERAMAAVVGLLPGLHPHPQVLRRAS